MGVTFKEIRTRGATLLVQQCENERAYHETFPCLSSHV